MRTRKSGFCKGGRGNYIFGTKSLKHKFKRLHLKVRSIQIQPALLKLNRCALLKMGGEEVQNTATDRAKLSPSPALFSFLPLHIPKESLLMWLASHLASLRPTTWALQSRSTRSRAPAGLTWAKGLFSPPSGWQESTVNNRETGLQEVV